MRVQMRLSNEARIILEEEKLNWLKAGIQKTWGQITDEIFEEFSSQIYKIDWLFVKNTSDYEGILADYTSVNPSALSLSSQTIEIIETLRHYLNNELNMTRTVYKSFVIRIILKAFKLKSEGINIYK